MWTSLDCGWTADYLESSQPGSQAGRKLNRRPRWMRAGGADHCTAAGNGQNNLRFYSCCNLMHVK